MAGFLGLIGGAAASGIASGITKGVGSLVGGLFSKKDKDYQKEKDLAGWQSMLEEDRMGLQAKLNKEQAKYSNELQKIMFDYTMKKEAEYNSPTAQVERLKAAGLNPALMYGGTGTTGSASGSTGGAQATGVSAVQPMGLQIALQAEMQKAQIEALKAQTMNTNAETAKTASEIKKTDSEAEEIGTEIELNKIKSAKTESEINSIAADIANKTEQLRGQIIQNDILDETKEFQINQAAEEYRQMVMQTQKLLAEAELTEKQKEMIQKEIDGFERKLQALEKQADASETSAEAAIDSAKAAYKSAEALEKQAGIAEEKSGSEIAKNWSGTLDGVLKAGGIILDLILLKKLKAAGFTLKGAYKVIKAARGS